MFSYKTHKHDSEVLLAICDKNLLGKKIEQSDIQIEIHESFYGNEECNEKEAIKLVKTSTIVNAVGEKIISVLMKNNIIEKEHILEIQGVPHAQLVAI